MAGLQGFENGVDDDRNGLVDDLVGWDFADGDNDPSDAGRYRGPGTFVAGHAAAVGDNGPGGTQTQLNAFGGISGVAWRARILPLRQPGEAIQAMMALATAVHCYEADVAIFSGSVSLLAPTGGLAAPLGGQFRAPTSLDGAGAGVGDGGLDPAQAGFGHVDVDRFRPGVVLPGEVAAGAERGQDGQTPGPAAQRGVQHDHSR